MQALAKLQRYLRSPAAKRNAERWRYKKRRPRRLTHDSNDLNGPNESNDSNGPNESNDSNDSNV
ncbi:MAG: hypothetical protein ACRD3G_22320 [Vicinamibacterales bacterium]